jgi:integrase
MQNGSITRSKRLKGPDVWEFRWRESGPDGKRKQRRMVIGSICQFADESAALRTITALRRDINLGSARLGAKPITVSELVDHYRQRELEPDTAWKTHSTKVTYQGYLNKWILPRWGAYPLSRIQAGEVELWLRSLPLARSTCAKARNLLCILFNHGMRYEIYDRNPIRLVRQSAKRRKIPVVLSVDEVQQLLEALALRERTLVLLDVATGLRMSELFGLKWADVNFYTNEVNVTRSIVMQVVGHCKTEASQKPIPLDPYLAKALQIWRQHTQYRAAEDWVFASPESQGRRPYWGQSIMRNMIRPTACRIGINKRIGWHTFRHTCSTLLRANRADIKVMQELLRHASSRVTMDTYTQAVTSQKRKAQSDVVGLIRTRETLSVGA